MNTHEIPVISDKHIDIPAAELYPKPDDERFADRRHLKTIFLAPGAQTVPTDFGYEIVSSDSYAYSFGLAKVEGFKETKADVAQELGTDASAAFFEELLKRVLDNSDIEIQHIVSGVHHVNEQPYQVFGYKRTK